MWLTFFFFFTILSNIRHKALQFVIKPQLIIIEDVEDFEERNCMEPCGSTLLLRQYVGTMVHSPNEKRLFTDEEDDTYEEENEFDQYVKAVYEEVAKITKQKEVETTESKDVTGNTEPNFDNQDNEKEVKQNYEFSDVTKKTKLLNDKNLKSKEEFVNTNKEMQGSKLPDDKMMRPEVLDCNCQTFISVLVFFSHRNKETFEKAVFFRRRNEFKPCEVETQK